VIPWNWLARYDAALNGFLLKTVMRDADSSGGFAARNYNHKFSCEWRDSAAQ